MNKQIELQLYWKPLITCNWVIETDSTGVVSVVNINGGKGTITLDEMCEMETIKKVLSSLGFRERKKVYVNGK